MKRGKAPQRRTPLRTSREKRTGRRNTGPDRSVRELVWDRDQGRCVRCGEGVYGRKYAVHHRRNRGSGGSSDPAINRPSNLVLVCDGPGSCHEWIGDSPAEAYEAGWMVSLNSKESTAEVPMIHAVLSASVLLTDEGTVLPVASWVPLDDGSVLPVSETGGAA